MSTPNRSESDDPSSGEGLKSLLEAAGSVARTVVNLHPAQLAFAPLQAVRSVLLGNVPAASQALSADRPARWTHSLLALDGGLDASLVGLPAELQRAKAALTGRLDLLGRSFDFSSQTGRLEALTVARPYRLELATLDVVRSLALASRTAEFAATDEAATLALIHLREVLERRPPGSNETWEPQVVTARFFNLLLVRELLGEDALAVELARHARWLSATLELQSPSTRLAEQGAALFVASCVLDTPGASGWRTVGSMLLSRSARRDVFLDGGHVTRSATLAAQHLQRLLYVLAAARAAACPPPEGVESAADRLARHLLAMSHPDGRPTAWRDSSDDGAPWPADLAGALGLTSGTLHEALLGRVAHVAPPHSRVCSRFDDTGVLAITQQGTHLVVFSAPPGTADAARHAHSDVGSFELSQDGLVLLREPGAGTFEPGAWRDHVRSPEAHSTVSVDGQGPDELWGGFLVGARGRREPMEYQAFDGGHVLRLSVRSWQGWRHERLFVLLPGCLLAVFDRVTDAPADANVVSHLHLPPGLRVQTEDALALIDAGEQPWLLERLSGESWSVREGEREPPRGWSAPTLGAFESSPVIELKAERRGGSFLAAWALALSSRGSVKSAPQGMFALQGRVPVRVCADARGLRWHRPD